MEKMNRIVMNVMMIFIKLFFAFIIDNAKMKIIKEENYTEMM